MPATVRPIVPLLRYQREDVEATARFNWCCWSRQIGKSFTKSLRRILRGLSRRRNQIFLSAGERQSRELMLKAQQHCQTLAIAAECLEVSSFEEMAFKHLEIVLPNGVRIIGLPANPQTVRGFTGDVFLDEFAMHREDREIWAAVFPSVLRGDGELDVASTPKGPANLFAELRGNAEFRHSTVTLHDAIAQGLDLDAEAIRRSMNDDALFRQEFLCEFVDEVGAFLTYERIRACEDGRLAAPVRQGATKRLSDEATKGAARRGERFVGVDVGRRRDLTAMWVVRFADGVRAPGVSRCDSQGGHVAVPPALSAACSSIIPPMHSSAGPSSIPPVRAPAALEGLRGAIESPRAFHGPCPLLLRGGELVTVAVVEMREAPFREQYDVLRDVMTTGAVRRCCIDATGVGMAMAEAAEEEFGGGRVEAVTFTPGMKDRLATGLKRRFEDRTIRVPADEAIRNDLHSVRWDVTAGGAGRFLVSHESDSHADRFWALALAIRAAESVGPAPRVEFETVRGLRFARAGIW